MGELTADNGSELIYFSMLSHIMYFSLLVSMIFLFLHEFISHFSLCYYVFALLHFITEKISPFLIFMLLLSLCQICLFFLVPGIYLLCWTLLNDLEKSRVIIPSSDFFSFSWIYCEKKYKLYFTIVLRRRRKKCCCPKRIEYWLKWTKSWEIIMHSINLVQMHVIEPEG